MRLTPFTYVNTIATEKNAKHKQDKRMEIVGFNYQHCYWFVMHFQNGQQSATIIGKQNAASWNIGCMNHIIQNGMALKFQRVRINWLGLSFWECCCVRHVLLIADINEINVKRSLNYGKVLIQLNWFEDWKLCSLSMLICWRLSTDCYHQNHSPETFQFPRETMCQLNALAYDATWWPSNSAQSLPLSRIVKNCQ